METTLWLIVVVTLTLAIGMAVIAWRLLRGDRQRQHARVTALRHMALDPPPEPVDASADALPDAFIDGIVDAMPDAIPDAMPDAMPDQVVDAAPDLGPVDPCAADEVLDPCGDPACFAAPACVRPLLDARGANDAVRCGEIEVTPADARAACLDGPRVAPEWRFSCDEVTVSGRLFLYCPPAPARDPDRLHVQYVMSATPNRGLMERRWSLTTSGGGLRQLSRGDRHAQVAVGEAGVDFMGLHTVTNINGGAAQAWVWFQLDRDGVELGASGFKLDIDMAALRARIPPD